MRALGVVLLSLSTACTAELDTEATSGEVSYLPESGGAAQAGSGWRNTPIPQHENDIVTVEFIAQPRSTGGPIDAIIGFSSQKADAYTDLGPIVRFGPQGRIDARDGGAYTADLAYTYTPNTEYRIRMIIDLYLKRYSVDVRLADPLAGDDWHRVAADHAFRTEQQTLSRIDNVAHIVSSSAGGVATYAFSVTPDVCVSGAPGWVAFPFPTQVSRFTVMADIIPTGAYGSPTLDAVVGLARYHPKTWSDLAVNLRFRPDGYMDARNGGTYAASNQTPYFSGSALRVHYQVDHAAKRYSVYVHDLDSADGAFPDSLIAYNFAYRTEQRNVVSLGWIGGYVDGLGTIRFCNVAAWAD